MAFKWWCTNHFKTRNVTGDYWVCSCKRLHFYRIVLLLLWWHDFSFLFVVRGNVEKKSFSVELQGCNRNDHCRKNAQPILQMTRVNCSKESGWRCAYPCPREEHHHMRACEPTLFSSNFCNCKSATCPPFCVGGAESRKCLPSFLSSGKLSTNPFSMS